MVTQRASTTTSNWRYDLLQTENFDSDGNIERVAWRNRLRVNLPSYGVNTKSRGSNGSEGIAKLRIEAASILVAVLAAAMLAALIFNVPWAHVAPMLESILVVLVPSVMLGALTLLAGMASPYYYGKKPWREARDISLEKISVLTTKILIPVGLYYADLASDIVVIQRFWHQGHPAFAVLNSLAIVAGLVSSASVTGLQDGLGMLFVLFHLNPLLVAVQSMLLFCAALSADGSDPRYRSLHGYFQSEGCMLRLAHSTVGEAFSEALLSTFVQTYALLIHAMSWNVLSFSSLILSLISIVKSFSFLDKYQQVSREINGQPILVGLAKPESPTFYVAMAFRLAEVSSQVLFFPLFQVVVNHMAIFGLRYSGVVLWSCDCVLQAILVYMYTKNWRKLVFAIPNTVGTYEPVLLVGPTAYLSTPAHLHALLHLAELILVLLYLFMFKSGNLYDLWESRVWMRWLLGYFACCNCARYLLFFFLRRFCAYQVDQVKVYVKDMLTAEALDKADEADKAIPLDIAAVAEFGSSGRGLDPQKLYGAMMQDQLQQPYIAGHMCRLASRAAHQVDLLAAHAKLLTAGEAVLFAMRKHLQVPEVQRAASRTLFNLAKGSSNKRMLAEQEALDLLLESVRQHPTDSNLRRYVFFALEVFAVDEGIRHQLVQMGGLLQPVLESLKEYRKDSVLQFATCGFIGQMAFDDVTLQREFVEANVVEEILQSQRKHLGDSDVQRTACLALRRLAGDDPEVVERLRGLGVAEDVRKAMETHVGQAALQYEAWKLLDTLDDKGKPQEYMQHRRSNAVANQSGPLSQW